MLLSRIVERFRGRTTPLFIGLALLGLLLAFNSSVRQRLGRGMAIGTALDPASFMSERQRAKLAVEAPRVQVLGLVRSLHRMHVELVILNTGTEPVAGQLWGSAKYAGAGGQWVQRAATQNFKAKVKSFKSLEFPIPPGDDGRFVSYEIFVSNAATGQVVRVTGLVPGSST